MNQKGFSVIEGLIIVIAVAAIGFAGWYVYDRSRDSEKDKTPETSQTHNETSHDDSESSMGATKKTVTFKTASYSVEVPKDWTFKEVPTEDSNENLVYIADPADELQLEIQILAKALTSGSAATGQTPEGTFMGIEDKTYYLNGYEGNSTTADAYELLQISACADKHCYTEINEDFDLNLAIRSTDGTTPVAATNSLVEEIEAIIKTIRL